MTAGDTRRILLQFFSCIDKKAEEDCKSDSEVGKFTAGEAGKGQLLCRNRRNLAKDNCEKNFVSRYSSLKHLRATQNQSMILFVLNLCKINFAHWATSVKILKNPPV